MTNICKFIEDASSGTLSVRNFICETDAATMLAPQLLKHHRMILISRGKLAFHLDGTVFSASVGTLAFVFAGEKFSLSPEGDCEYLYISFSGGRAGDLFRRFGIHKGNRFFENFDNLLPLWKDSLVRASKENIDLAAESVLLYTLSRFSASPDKQNTIIQKMLEITEHGFGDPTLSISALSKMLSYNPKYLSHLFKEKMGVGYTEYLRTYRIKYAITLMDHGIDSVKNLASLCGFQNPLYFSAVFKKAVGIPPSEYKKPH
ncbi:MAG: helix-turn-helix transcriptional regulator [Clostridia bacterium]|nr:helix-turn-helix transcriptional regulator [Clostridia bacterium]